MKSFLCFYALFLLQATSIFASEYRNSQNFKIPRMPKQHIPQSTTPLHQAASDFARFDEIPMCIQAKINVNLQDLNGNTALHLLVEYNPFSACTTNSSEPHPAWLERRNKENFEYLRKNVEALLLAKASVIIKNHNDQNPIDIAEESALVKEFGCRDIVKLLNDFKPKRYA